MVRELVESGAVINKEDKNGYTPFMVAFDAKNIDMIRLLIELGAADINKEYDDGLTPLSEAIYVVDVDIVKLFIKSGLDINKKNKYGETAYSSGDKRCNPQIFKILKEAGANLEEHQLLYLTHVTSVNNF